MAVMVIDGGGGALAGPSPQQQTHVVTGSDTVANLADRFGVTPQALRQANPQVFQEPSVHRREQALDGGDLLLTGETINIPPASQSITDDPLGSDFNPTYPSPNSEYTFVAEGSHGGGSVVWNPGDGSIKVTGSATAAPPGQHGQSSVHYTARGEATVGHVNKDGNTECTVEVLFSASANVEGQSRTSLGVVEGEASMGAGSRARYKVTLPGENQNAGAAAKINPFDPTTIPVGATVTMDGQSFTQTSLAGSFRHIGMQTNVTDAAGTSYSVTRVDPHNVRVTMGPNEAVEAFNGMGLRSGIASAMLGRQDNLGASTVRTAQFDLSNLDGQAAYSHFVATGDVAHQTPGVSDVATVERVDYSSQTRAMLEVGPVQANLAGAQNTGAFVRTTYPDGSYTATSNLQYSGNVPLQVTQRFDASGNEVLSERTYQFKVNGDRPDYGWFDRFMGANEGAEEAMIAANLNVALTGSPDGAGPALAGKTTTITFTESQIQSLMTQTRNAGEAMHVSSPLNLLVGGDNGHPVATSLDFAVAMARNLGGDPSGFAQRLMEVSIGADGDLRNGYDRLDATVS